MSAVFLFCLLFCFTGTAFADLYKYVDANGVVCMTNALESVPKRYRTSLTVVKEDQPAPKKLLPEVQKINSDPLPQPAAESRQTLQNTAPTATGDNSRYLHTGLIISSVVVAYFLLGRLAAALGTPRVGTILFLLLVLGGGIYLYGLYINEMRVMFSSLRKDAMNIRRNVETREKKSDDLLKQLPEKE